MDKKMRTTNEYSYDINHKTIDKTSSKNLFACHTLLRVTSIFSSTFLVAYIYSFSLDTFDYINRVCVYYLSIHIAFLLSYWLFALITDKTNRIWVYRVSLILRMVFVIIIVFFGKNMANLLVLSGALYGISDACYYASFNVLKQEMVSRKTMGSFATWLIVSQKGVDILAPITLGALIEVSTYFETSIYISVIVGVMLVLSMFIKAQKPKDSDYSLKDYCKKLKNCENKEVRDKMKFLYISAFIYGFTSIVGVLLDVCVMLQLGSTLSLGSITSAIGVFTIFEMLFLNKCTKPGKRDWMFYVLMIMPLVVSIVFAIWASSFTVVLYNFGITVTKVVNSTVYDIYRNSNLKEAGLYSEISEHQTIIESIFSISRILSYIILFIVGLTKNLVVFKVSLVVLSFSFTCTLFCLMLYERRYVKDKSKPKEQSIENEKYSESIVEEVMDTQNDDEL